MYTGKPGRPPDADRGLALASEVVMCRRTAPYSGYFSARRQVKFGLDRQAWEAVLTRHRVFVLMMVAVVLTTDVRPSHGQIRVVSPTVASRGVQPVPPVDINSAPQGELVRLLSIGDAIAKKIVDGRPYGRREDLITRDIVSKATYDRIKAQLMVRHPYR